MVTALMKSIVTIKNARVRLEQSPNVPLSIAVTELDSSTESRLSQAKIAFSPIKVTDFGVVIET
jgi:hypothetical protein